MEFPSPKIEGISPDVVNHASRFVLLDSPDRRGRIPFCRLSVKNGKWVCPSILPRTGRLDPHATVVADQPIVGRKYVEPV